MLCELGYKEIEVSFPSASQIDFDFTRRLIETPGVIPDDVAIQVLSPCRPDLIRRTVESVRGAKNAIIHIYLATSACFRQVVFGYSEQQTLDLAVECTKLVKSLTKDNPEAADTNWQFEFSPECFSDTDPDYALRVCKAVKAAWGPDVTKKDTIIFNLPATVELATPNIYADQIEYFSNNIGDRESVCVSLVRTPMRLPQSSRPYCVTRANSLLCSTLTTTVGAVLLPPSLVRWPAPTAWKAAFSATVKEPATSTSSH